MTVLFLEWITEYLRLIRFNSRLLLGFHSLYCLSQGCLRHRYSTPHHRVQRNLFSRYPCGLNPLPHLWLHHFWRWVYAISNRQSHLFRQPQLPASAYRLKCHIAHLFQTASTFQRAPFESLFSNTAYFFSQICEPVFMWIHLLSFYGGYRHLSHPSPHFYHHQSFTLVSCDFTPFPCPLIWPQCFYVIR